jgi:hypothetical protein
VKTYRRWYRDGQLEREQATCPEPESSESNLQSVYDREVAHQLEWLLNRWSMWADAIEEVAKGTS